MCLFFFFSSRRRHTRLQGDWSSNVCSSDLVLRVQRQGRRPTRARRADRPGVRSVRVGAEVIALRRPKRSIVHLRLRLRDEPRARLAAFVAVFGLLSALVLLLAPPAVVTYEAGVVADRAVRAPRSVSYYSEVLTSAEREKAAASVARQYTRNPAVVANETSQLGNAINTITRTRADTAQSRDQKIVALTRIADTPIGGTVAQDLVDMPVAEWEALARDLDRLLGTLYSTGIREGQHEASRADIAKILPSCWVGPQAPARRASRRPQARLYEDR